MPRTAAAKLTSEERCRKAFEEKFNQTLDGRELSIDMVFAWAGWKAAWQYLESRVTEFMES